jgi:hypothetical protein
MSDLGQTVCSHRRVTLPDFANNDFRNKHVEVPSMLTPPLARCLLISSQPGLLAWTRHQVTWDSRFYVNAWFHM